MGVPHDRDRRSAGRIWGGKHAAFPSGEKLLVWAGNNAVRPPDRQTQGTPTSMGTLFASGLQNGVMLRDRVYFADGARGRRCPSTSPANGTAFAVTSLRASAPKAKLVGVYKERLIAAGDPAQPQRVYFSPLEIPDGGGPPGSLGCTLLRGHGALPSPRSRPWRRRSSASTPEHREIRGGIPPGGRPGLGHVHRHVHRSDGLRGSRPRSAAGRRT